MQLYLAQVNLLIINLFFLQVWSFIDILKLQIADANT
jgi:hypothetical protein